MKVTAKTKSTTKNISRKFLEMLLNLEKDHSHTQQLVEICEASSDEFLKDASKHLNRVFWEESNYNECINCKQRMSVNKIDCHEQQC